MLNVRRGELQLFFTVPKSRSLGVMVRHDVETDALTAMSRWGWVLELMPIITLPTTVWTDMLAEPIGHARTVMFCMAPGGSSTCSRSPAGSVKIGSLPGFMLT